MGTDAKRTRSQRPGLPRRPARGRQPPSYTRSGDRRLAGISGSEQNGHLIEDLVAERGTPTPAWRDEIWLVVGPQNTGGYSPGPWWVPRTARDLRLHTRSVTFSGRTIWRCAGLPATRRPLSRMEETLSSPASTCGTACSCGTPATSWSAPTAPNPRGRVPSAGVESSYRSVDHEHCPHLRHD